MTTQTVINFYCSFNKFSVPTTYGMENTMSDTSKLGEFVCMIKIELANGDINFSVSVPKIAKPVSGN